MDQPLKRLPGLQETWIQSLGWEDPVEKRMATHSSILAWRNPWTEEPGGIQSMGSQRVGPDWVTNTSYSYCRMNLFMNSSVTFNMYIDSQSHYHNHTDLSIKKISLCCSLIIKSSLLPASRNPLLIFRSYSFSISKVSSEWNHAAF